MVTTSIGRAAEKAVADFLVERGYKIIEHNWRTRWCEVDIIALKDKTVYFIEVKYRINQSQGSGLEYIGPKKLRQMSFSAEFWNSQNNWHGDYSLIAAEVTGIDFENINLVEIT